MQDALGQRFDIGVPAATFDGYPLVDVEVLEGLDTTGAMGTSECCVGSEGIFVRT